MAARKSVLVPFALFPRGDFPVSFPPCGPSSAKRWPMPARRYAGRSGGSSRSGVDWSWRRCGTAGTPKGPRASPSSSARCFGATGVALAGGRAHAAANDGRSGQPASGPHQHAAALQQVLLALPALGFAAGVALGAAAALMVLRALLGTEMAPDRRGVADVLRHARLRGAYGDEFRADALPARDAAGGDSGRMRGARPPPRSCRRSRRA